MKTSKKFAINKANNITTKSFKNTIQTTIKKAENIMFSAFNIFKATALTADNIVLISIISLMILIIILITSVFGMSGKHNDGEPNFYNIEAYETLNPYAQKKLYGQCTWFAWGRFYEIYGYDPGFTGDSWNCVDELIASHPDTWIESDVPTPNCVFSGVGVNHVGIVTQVNGNMLTI